MVGKVALDLFWGSSNLALRHSIPWRRQLLWDLLHATPQLLAPGRQISEPFWSFWSLQKWRCPKMGVPPVIIHFERWDVPWNKPTSYWDTMTMESPPRSPGHGPLAPLPSLRRAARAPRPDGRASRAGRAVRVPGVETSHGGLRTVKSLDHSQVITVVTSGITSGMT